MIRWLFIILFIYLVYKLIKGPDRTQQRKKPFFTFHFGKFPEKNDQQNRNRSNKPNLDHLEEAEYEDITTDEKES